MGKPLEPERIANSEYIPLSVVARKKYLPLTVQRLAQMCRDGIFKSAFQPGTGGKGSKWLVLRSEVIQRRINGHGCPQY
jgi:hypothetical protein